MGKIKIVTPEKGFYCNTYYDKSPWSPSVKHPAVTKLPYQDQITVLGDTAEVCIIYLEE